MSIGTLKDHFACIVVHLKKFKEIKPKFKKFELILKTTLKFNGF